MTKSQVDSLTLIIATLAGALSLTQLSSHFAWMSSIGGLIILFILFAFDQEGYRTVFQSLAFSAVCGFAAAIASGIFYQILANHGEVHLANGEWATFYLPITCAIATAIFWAIDTMRMSARRVAPIRVPRALGETGLGIAPPYMYEAPAPAPGQNVAAAPPPAATPATAAAPGAAYAAPEPIVQPEPPRPEPVQDIPTATSFFAIPQTLPPSPQAAAPIAIPPSGKETMIYVSLLGEGLNVMRSVRAEPLGRDFYRIIDEMPEGETWQFQPGQVVRCKKKTLSSGKAMVAMEEAPRAV